jgi:trans-2,3-dihydro-3-hydroxyanthranilate isomerase
VRARVLGPCPVTDDGSEQTVSVPDRRLDADPLVGDGLRYDLVDVFTDRAFAGNPLAVVYDAHHLSTEQQQAVAREFNLSETTFPDVTRDPAAADQPDYRLRIYTPVIELPFAGHPSIGTAWALNRRGLVSGPALRQECRVGTLDLLLGSATTDPVWLTGGTPHLGAEVDSIGPLAAVGLGEGDLVGLPTLVAGTGLDFCYVLVRPGSIARAVPDLQRLRRLRWQGSRIGGVAVVGWHDGSARARVFTDDIGPAEDPATGSAALGLGVVLVHVGLLAADGESSFTVRQGIELGRPSTLQCRVEARDGRAVRCHVGGGVVPVATGTIRRPERY